ncbi:DUF6461 domain-containing protein [Microtetraspora malaysiensis]|uniref:DUF6461 domain-containing protein n=1 Tax=Microtetraspora malaysiensis TaxID=161358 RepID=UPI00082C69D2|nr:DUF6461 domain-containing protein [Microtetraspora malaysiensis]
MVELSRADFDWLRDITVLGHAWSLTFVRGVDEAEALRRLGAQQVDIRLFTKEECPLPEVVRAWRLGDWTVIIEVADCRLVDPKVTDALSAQTETIMIFENVNGWSGFEHVVDGQLMTSFDPVAACLREGDEPDRFVEEMRAAGFDPDTVSDEDFDLPDDEGSLFVLTALLTGVVLTWEIFDGPLPGALVK